MGAEFPKPLTAEQIKDFEEKRKKSDDRLKSGGAGKGREKTGLIFFMV